MPTNISRYVEGIERSWIREMPVLAAKLHDTVSLGQGIPSFELPRYIKDALATALYEVPSINRYSLQPGMPELREEVAKRLKVKKGIDIDPEKELFISAGSMEGLNSVIRTVVHDGDEVIIPSPAYEPHINLVRMYGGRPVFVKSIEEEGWRYDLDGLEKRITDKTKSVILCNPSNPTGYLLEERELRAICDLALKHDFYVISDEAYDFLVYDGKEHFSPASAPEYKDKVIVTGTFSKEFAMTGFRVGHVYGSPNVIENATKVHDNTVICAPTIGQFAALFALTRNPDRNYSEQFMAEFTERRALILERLERLNEFFEYQKPMGAYYVFPRIKIPIKSSIDFALELLYGARVVTIPGSPFGEGGENHIRLSFAGEEEEINEAFDRLERYLVK